MSVHVPAWQRLGLKLKYANERTEPVKGFPRPVTVAEARREVSGPSERPTKRQRLIVDGHESPKSNGISTSHQELNQSKRPSTPGRTSGVTADTGNSVTDHRQARTRKKSVSFAHDTKVVDGDTRTTIDFPAGSPGTTPRKALSQDITTGSDSEGSSDSHVNEDDRAVTKKTPKKPKVGKKAKAGPRHSKNKLKPALNYLEQHRSDRALWKFNKNRDVWIISHALNCESIPTSSLLALAGYIRGLPDRAGARTRLITDCREALAESGMENDHSRQDREIFLRMVNGDEANVETDVEAFLHNHSRPALLLWALDEDVGTTNARQSPAAPLRKKKSRTSAPIDISSSSEDDTDSDSSDGGLGIGTNGTADSDTSLSGTSDSEDDTSSSESSSDST